MSTLSRFLPADYDATAPVAVIAGQRVYPQRTIAALRAKNVPVRLIAFESETLPEVIDSFPEDERVVLKVGQLGKLLRAIERFGAKYALMVGQITPGKLFRDTLPDLKAVSLLARLKERNAETIFGAIADEIARVDCTLLDARAFLDEELATEGLMTGKRLPVEEKYIAHGVEVARGLARLDVGQGCVVRKGTVLAAEAFEGTDAMLRRAGSFKTEGLIFVKTVKPGQDLRFDVPVFGTQTLDVMDEAGIGTAALQVGGVLMLEKEHVLARAREANITLYGFGA